MLRRVRRLLLRIWPGLLCAHVLGGEREAGRQTDTSEKGTPHGSSRKRITRKGANAVGMSRFVIERADGEQIAPEEADVLDAILSAWQLGEETSSAEETNEHPA